MRRVLLGVVVLVFAPAAQAAPPTVTVKANAQRGVVPFVVTLTATGDAVSYRWELGDGTSVDSATASHTYRRSGRFVAAVTATGADGSITRVQVPVTAHRLVLGAPSGASVGARVRLRGSLAPVLPARRAVLLRAGEPVASAPLRRGGRFAFATRLRAPGPYRVRVGKLVSAPRTIAVRPHVAARIVGSGVVGEPLAVVAAVKPAGLATFRVRVWRDDRLIRSVRAHRPVRLRLPSGRPASFRVHVIALRGRGSLPASLRLAAAAVHPLLGLGSRGPSVRVVERRLRELRYALPRVDSYYGGDTAQAVLAFQKVSGLPWTGRVDGRVWRRLLAAGPPRAHYRGDHIEVSKRQQVLYVVRDSRVELVVHVSTGATGNTPLGRWRVYRKVRGWDWVLWYPMYFLRGFAIHGYPSVPAYPASHGCVRVPMWVAPQLFAGHGHGTTVYVI